MVDVKKFLFLFSSPKILVVTQQQKYFKDIVYHVTKTQFLTKLSTIIIPERGRRLLVFVNLSITLLFCGTLASNWPRSVEKLILTHFLGEIAGKSVFFKPLHEEDRHYGRMVQGFEFKSGFLSSSPSCYHWIGFFSVLQISIPSLWCVNSTMVWPPPPITVIGLKLKVTLERVFGSFVWEYYSRKEQIVLVVTNVSTSW